MTELDTASEPDAPTGPSVTEFGPQDFTYLHTDTDSSPGHWSIVLELADGAEPLTLGAVRDRVRERVSLFDLFRIGVAGGRETPPEIVVADAVDVDRHVTELRFTDRADLYRQIAAELETALPRPDPFWRITLLTSDDAGQFVLLKVHHCVSDGIAGAAFAALLADGSPEELSEFERFATSPRFRVGEVDPDTLASSRAAFEEQWAAGEIERTWPKLTSSGRREMALFSASTRDLRRAAKNHGASVHEFLLGAIGRSLSLAPPNPDASASEILRVTLPVTLDPAFRHTGNAVAIALLNLAGNETDLDRQIERARAELATIESKNIELALAAGDDVLQIPWADMRSIVGESMARMSPDIHIGINPGFSRVRSVLGVPIAELTPVSPLVGYSFSVTCLILGKSTSFGIAVDAEALPGYADTFVEQFARVLAEAAPES
ncbi:wax ester/triacylglycerol synthase domain-containing protein [Gordonia soli]|uniref:O-acyltransferase WSD1-like N-terminal domain-containing protein n=1 Tax=Gordonia soli NBRC 108243 TaxID=1223545 RepID=M0QS13_9ACTN|nr:wax ester/triacylglycerol synthase domain-containing protein [Gordonia soli]GAC70647.1 hypothetical protein GS4_38_00530 [Gordonia soli NBRC 108243]